VLLLHPLLKKEKRKSVVQHDQNKRNNFFMNGIENNWREGGKKR
jgi:hypothetical protein